ncbi:peptide-binding protein [Roseivivax halodurans JCM 10272]|uniref:Peptide-binding protein n=1 Tax=Roseivivax halodurans JCM 10272 TaxID=1449350 RepID=X7EH25_9RHOB|nr:SH3 domain-containing protein [Roseivivax halodurans]ETX14388.1 peptide-binding protein [Roseivivax halodurans JCM 10272]
MGRVMASVLALGMLTACGAGGPGGLLGDGRYEVMGVEEGDMLKLRAGPGTGFDVRAGLPNGTIVHAGECQRLGATRWCEVTLDGTPGMRGYVSQSYLRAL